MTQTSPNKVAPQLGRDSPIIKNLQHFGPMLEAEFVTRFSREAFLELSKEKLVKRHLTPLGSAVVLHSGPTFTCEAQSRYSALTLTKMLMCRFGLETVLQADQPFERTLAVANFIADGVRTELVGCDEFISNFALSHRFTNRASPDKLILVAPKARVVKYRDHRFKIQVLSRY